MLITDSCRIGGQIVGLGVVHADGTEDFHWLDKPIHNRITSVGLDHLLCEKGNVSGGYVTTARHQSPVTFLRSWNYTIPGREGALAYSRLGTDGTATEFEDTALREAVTDYSNTYRTGSPFTGTQVTSAGEYRFRVTYESKAVSSACTVKEFGVFGKAGDAYKMFARIAIPEGIELEANEKLLVTYELRMSHTESVEHMDDFGGLTDSTGEPLQCDTKLYTSCTTSTGFDGKLGKYPYISTNAYEEDYYNPNLGEYYHFLAPYYYGANLYYGDCDTVGYSTTPQEFGVSNDKLTTARSKGGDYKFEFVDYEGVGNADKHRDVKVTLGAYNPGMLDITDYVDIYFMRFRGMDYKFGYTQDGVFVPQCIRKFGGQQLSITFRTRYVTDDTVPNKEA